MARHDVREAAQIIHASAVRHAGGAVLITGASGKGKSGLALHLMAFGADLVADDRVALTVQEDVLIASCPATINGLIEARGVGILNATPCGPTPVVLVIDLDRRETERLPKHRIVTYLGHNVPLLWHVDSPHFPAMLMQILSHGRSMR